LFCAELRKIAENTRKNAPYKKIFAHPLTNPEKSVILVKAMSFTVQEGHGVWQKTCE
jgi:hypothetical protein